jgi:hypothetical protein
MTRGKIFAGFGAGLIAGALISAAISGGHGVPRAMGQEQPRPPDAAPGRYQVSAWAHPGVTGIGGPGHGAYILDTATGQLWVTRAEGGARKVGRLE